jgi:nucleoside-diphosphate-sugar epimerase
MPFGIGNFLGTRGYVRDIAKGVRLALESPGAAGQVFNLGEPVTLTMRQLAEAIIEASGADLELAQVPDEALPTDLRITGVVQQHFLVDSSKARQTLGWKCDDWKDSLKVTVEWHLSHPPQNDEKDFSADDVALAAT